MKAEIGKAWLEDAVLLKGAARQNQMDAKRLCSGRQVRFGMAYPPESTSSWFFLTHPHPSRRVA